MISTKIRISNSVGLHARPVVQLAAAANEYMSDVRLNHNGCSVDAKSSVRLLSLGVNNGETVELTVSGEDEQAAFNGLMTVFSEINNQ